MSDLKGNFGKNLCEIFKIVISRLCKARTIFLVRPTGLNPYRNKLKIGMHIYMNIKGERFGG